MFPFICFQPVSFDIFKVVSGTSITFASISIQPLTLASSNENTCTESLKDEKASNTSLPMYAFKMEMIG